MPEPVTARSLQVQLHKPGRKSIITIVARILVEIWKNRTIAVPLTLRPIHRDHLRRLFRLKVAKGQEGQVAPNEITLAQQAYEPGGYVWGLWEGEEIVGLLAMIHPGEVEEVEEGDDPEAAYVWRLMIGEQFQGRGLGREAIDRAMEVARGWHLPRISLSFVDKPGGAEGFYLKCGFVRTGRIVEGEVEMMRDV